MSNADPHIEQTLGHQALELVIRIFMEAIVLVFCWRWKNRMDSTTTAVLLQLVHATLKLLERQYTNTWIRGTRVSENSLAILFPSVCLNYALGKQSA